MNRISLAYGQPRVHVPEYLEANCASRTSDKRDPRSGDPWHNTTAKKLFETAPQLKYQALIVINQIYIPHDTGNSCYRSVQHSPPFFRLPQNTQSLYHTPCMWRSRIHTKWNWNKTMFVKTQHWGALA